MKTKMMAFTLAETLVVMGIIGVIAALTIPNLSQSTGNREKVTKIKKAYSQLSEAFDRAQAIYGPIDEWFQNDTTRAMQATRYGERMVEFLKVSKNCKVSTDQDCYGLASFNTNGGIYKVILADGQRVGFNNGGEYKYINVNLSKNVKSTADYDKEEFTFMAKNGYVEPLCDYNRMATQFVNTRKNGGQFDCASRWIIEFDNMDYTKVDKDLKCTNGSGRVLNLTANPPVTSCN